MSTELEKAYVAGFLDGEGHIGMTLARARRNGDWRTHVIIVTLANINLDVLRWVQTLWSNGTLIVRSQPKQSVPIGNLRYSSAAAAVLLRDVQPYLRIKVQQATIALQFAEEMAQRERRARPITPEEWEQREDWRLAIREANRPHQNLLRYPMPGYRWERTCPHCGMQFNRQGTNRVYCSLKCGQAARWQREKQRMMILSVQ